MRAPGARPRARSARVRRRVEDVGPGVERRERSGVVPVGELELDERARALRPQRARRLPGIREGLARVGQGLGVLTPLEAAACAQRAAGGVRGLVVEVGVEQAQGLLQLAAAHGEVGLRPLLGQEPLELLVDLLAGERRRRREGQQGPQAGEGAVELDHGRSVGRGRRRAKRENREQRCSAPPASVSPRPWVAQ